MSGGPPTACRSFSVVVNTLDRAESLALTLEGLARLEYPSFEIVVVNGPSTDHTADVLESWQGRIKVGHCAERNLSQSRNVGIGLAAGEVVAFIDDDAYPDPAWLDRLNEAYDDDEVAGAGGPVYSHTGYDLQTWVNFADRLGHVWDRGDEPIDYSSTLAFPLSRQFVTLIGTNSSFRRPALLEVGGFDEDFVYFLDETELCCRLVDAGHVIRSLDDGFVYHKFLSNDIRGDNQVLRDSYQTLKSTIYMALKHGLRAHSFLEVSESVVRAVDTLREHFEHHVAAGDLSEADRAKFEQDAHLAADAALGCFLRPRPLVRDEAWFRSLEAPFLRFEPTRPSGRRLHVCLLSREYPPGPVSGIGRQVHSLATGLAAAGHLVRVLTASSGNDRVDLEDGVWVHRIVPRPHPLPAAPRVPQAAWDHSASMHDELLRVHAHRPVDLVQAPNWDSEGLATVLDGRVPVLVAVYTPLKVVAAVDPGFGERLRFGDPELTALVDAERYVYEHAAGASAASTSILAQVETEYGVDFSGRHRGIVPHGLGDAGGTVTPVPHPGTVDVLFVGRLEARKGIDTLLAVVPDLLAAHPEARFVVVGEDSIGGPDGHTPRAEFEAGHPELADRVVFTGVVDDEVLRSHYASCDIFVAPSRFESFGLVLLEAMMFSKPVVTSGCTVDVVEDGVSGFVVEPGDPKGLEAALTRLLGSEALRTQLGDGARRAYEERFTVDAMVQGMVESFGTFLGPPPTAPASAPTAASTGAASAG